MKTNDSLEMAVLTGCLRVSKESLFTGLNNYGIAELINGGYVLAPVHEDMVYADIEVNREDIWSFLLFTGYLKQIGSEMQDGEIYLKMVIPNLEVRTLYRRMIMTWFKDSVRADSREDLLEALLSENAEKVTDIIGRWLDETISFYDTKEMYYHGFLAGLLSGIKGWKLISNRESGDGRPDLLLLHRRPQDVAVILEIKEPEEGRTLKSLAEQALHQIEKNRYDSEPINDGYTKIIRYGAAFRKKKCLIKLG